MASLTKRPGGRVILRFNDSDRVERSIFLGNLSDDHADTVKRHVEELVRAKLVSCSPSPDTSRWLASVDRKMLGKLARVGLVSPADIAGRSDFLGYADAFETSAEGSELASLSKTPDGRRVVQFVDGEGHRKTIYLGRMPEHLAESVKIKIESIIHAKMAGENPPAEVAAWLERIDDRLLDGLIRTGLVEKSDAKTIGSIVSAVCNSGLITKGMEKHYTNLKHRINLYWKPDTPVSSLTLAAGQEWLDFLIKQEGLAESTVSKTAMTARHLFGLAIQLKLTDSNPFLKLNKADIRTARINDRAEVVKNVAATAVRIAIASISAGATPEEMDEWVRKLEQWNGQGEMPEAPSNES
jgi:hypothetical protein